MDILAKGVDCELIIDRSKYKEREIRAERKNKKYRPGSKVVQVEFAN